MKARVRGFRGCEKGDVEINPIALVAGLNGAGKSSLLQAAAAAATGQAIPFFRSSRPEKPILTKTDAKALLRGGMDAGGCQLEVDGQVASDVRWPALTVSGNGAVQCSLVAAGLVNPMEMEEQDRQRFFSTLLNADPTMKDLHEAVAEAIPAAADLENADDHGKTPADNLVTRVETDGWDVTHKATKERGARVKGNWEGKSGVAFGAKKAAGWRPEGWREHLANATLEELGTEATQAQAKVERAIASQAVDQAVLATLKEQAAAEAGVYNALQEADSTLATAKAALRKAEDTRQAITIPTAHPCPHCGGLLDISMDLKTKKGFEVKEAEASAAQIEQAKAAYESASVVVQKALAAVETAQAVYVKASPAYFAVKGATEKLMEAEKRAGSEDDVAVARDFLSGVMKDKDMVEKVQACETLAAQIAANQKLVDILAPEGLRRQKLQKALAKFNKDFLGALSANAGYSTVTIDDELEILYGGRRYFLLSASEQYRVRAVVQIAVAMYDRSPLVIFDGADILDKDGRNGLFGMMSETSNLKFLVGMTVLARKNAPDLNAAGMGSSYWIEDGTAQDLVST